MSVVRGAPILPSPTAIDATSAQSSRSAYRRPLFWVTLGLALIFWGVLAYLALRPDPALKNWLWRGNFIGRWADHYPAFRNFPAFAAASVLCVLPWLALQPQPERRSFWGYAFIGLGVAILGVALEVSQRWIPTRFFDWYDILWTVAGAFAGAAGSALGARVLPSKPET